LAALCALPGAAGALLRAADPDQPKPQATPTPAPKASPAPQPTPASKTPLPAKTPAPVTKTKPETGPSLSFTDFDLERYHRPSPAKDEPAAEEDDEAGAATPAATGGVPGPPRPIPPAAPAGAGAGKTAGRAAQSAKRPQTPLETTQDDPLRPFKDREAKEKFRNEQIKGLRDHLAQIQTRLDYLQGKRQAILDPLTIMPKPPAGEETQGEAAMRPKELLQKVDEEIKALKDEQEQAQDQLTSVETRFAQESQSR